MDGALPRPPSPHRPPGLDLPVVSHTLSNGLTMLVLRREGAPVASFLTQFGVGSADEEPGISGVSHLLEHMLKKGTSRLGTRDWEAERALLPVIDEAAARLHAARREGADASTLTALEKEVRDAEQRARAYIVTEAYDHVLKSHGARGRNATTGADRTNYYVNLPVERAEVWFALEGQRLQDLVFRDFYSERDVVMEERRRGYDTQPWGKVREAMQLLAFDEHPYRILTIGHMEDLLVMDREVVSSWFRRFYSALNGVVVIVGHVDPERMFALGERYLTGLPRGEARRRREVATPEPQEPRRAHIGFDAEPHLAVSWHVPALDHEDSPALSILHSVLSEGRTSRLYQRAVLRDHVVTELSCAFTPGEWYNRLMTVYATPRRPHSAGEVEDVIVEEVQRLIEPLSSRELEAVHNRREAHDLRRMQSNAGLAWQLGLSHGLWGSWHATFEFSRRMSATTAEDLVRAARRWLRPEARRVVCLSREPDPSTP